MTRPGGRWIFVVAASATLVISVAIAQAVNVAEVSVSFQLHNQGGIPALPADSFKGGDGFVSEGLFTGDNTSGQPAHFESPPRTATLDFDDSYKLTTKGLAQCDKNLAPKDLGEAAGTCKGAQIAVTEGNVCYINTAPDPDFCSNYNAEMILYNAPPKNGTPQFLIYVEDARNGGPALVVLKAKLVNAPSKIPDRGKRLSVTMPLLDGGDTEISNIGFNIFKKWRDTVHGHTVKRWFISARCDDGNEMLDASMSVKYDNDTTNVDGYSYPCDVA